MLAFAIIAMLAAAGVSIPVISNMLGKQAGNAASKKNSSNFFQKIGDWFKNLFKKGKNSPANSVTGVGSDGFVTQLPLGGSSDMSTPLDGVGDISQTSAQQSGSQPDVAVAVDSSQATGDGGSAQNSENQYDYIKHLFSTLGLMSLLSGDKENYGWMQSYGDIVSNEREYGQSMINDARKWEEQMASTAYQRTVKDLEAAGLNPWLALQSGGLQPASVGSVDSGSALGSISTSLSQSISQGNSNSSSAIIVALIAMLAKFLA